VSDLSASFILAYHGCDHEIAESLLSGKPFQPSENGYDWLGSGIYFWQENPARAQSWAYELERRGMLKVPVVVGAVINLRNCLDLVSGAGIATVKEAHKSLVQASHSLGRQMPTNSGGDDLLLFRKLDCAVINNLHGILKERRRTPYDTVRGVFLEGKRIYDTSGFREKTHIQVCVRNIECIKGVFRVPQDPIS
jgi:hypothetical protein